MLSLGRIILSPALGYFSLVNQTAPTPQYWMCIASPAPVLWSGSGLVHETMGYLVLSENYKLALTFFILASVSDIVAKRLYASARVTRVYEVHPTHTYFRWMATLLETSRDSLPILFRAAKLKYLLGLWTILPNLIFEAKPTNFFEHQYSLAIWYTSSVAHTNLLLYIELQNLETFRDYFPQEVISPQWKSHYYTNGYNN